VHGVLIGAALGAVSPGPLTGARRERVEIVDLPVIHPRSAAPAESHSVAAPWREGFQVLTPPMEVPTTLPGLDVAQPHTIEDDFSGRGLAGGVAGGISVAALPASGYQSGDPIDGKLADVPPYLLPDQMGPDYPDELRDVAMDGIVVVRFVLDTLGRPEPGSIAVVSATNAAFVTQVRTSLGRLRFTPAKLVGRLVRARIEQRFDFHLASR
jgi:periplasmic protein TonB